MTRSKSKTIPNFGSLDELVNFFDTHDLGEYGNDLPEAHFDVDIKTRKHLFALDDEIANELLKIAKLKKINSETLINSWLKEKIQGQI